MWSTKWHLTMRHGLENMQDKIQAYFRVQIENKCNELFYYVIFMLAQLENFDMDGFVHDW